MRYFLYTILSIGMFLLFFIYSKEHAPQTKPVKIEEQKKSSTPLLFLGDIMLGRHVETLAKKNGQSFMFASTSEFLKSHITVANLEGPIPEVHEPTPVNGFSFSFPSSTPIVLRENGVAAVSLANNHMFDKGEIGFENTQAVLRREGVSYFGGYSPTKDNYFETKLGAQTAIVYGITMIATGWNEWQAIEVTEKLRREHPGAHLIAFLHWGDEYVPQNEYQRAFARRLIDSGVDTVVGAHPHVVQGVEIYKDTPIFYSLGNFIFDQYWRKDLEDGYVLRISDDDNAIKYEIIPVHSVRSVPSIAKGKKREEILTTISNHSDESIKTSVLGGTIRIQK